MGENCVDQEEPTIDSCCSRSSATSSQTGVVLSGCAGTPMTALNSSAAGVSATATAELPGLRRMPAATEAAGRCRKTHCDTQGGGFHQGPRVSSAFFLLREVNLNNNNTIRRGDGPFLPLCFP